MPDERVKLDPSAYLAPGENSRFAITRRTRTPIEFTREPASSESGLYTAPNLLLSFLSHLIPTNPKGTIKIYPYSADQQGGDMNKMISHEEIHSLLNSINPFGTGAADPRGVQGYDAIADGIKRGLRGGDPIAEVPAYAGAFEMNRTPVEQSVRDEFVKAFAAKLAASDSSKASMYKELSR